MVEVTGLIDGIEYDYLKGALRHAAATNATVVVLRLDTPGSVLSARKIAALTRAISHGPVPVAVWIGPGKRARAGDDAARLVQASDVVGVVPGSSPARDFAAKTPIAAATLGDFIVGLDGKVVRSETLNIPTTVVRRAGRPPQRQLDPAARVAFAQPSLPAQLLHGVASPSVAYLLFVAGLLLVAFEFFTAGVGVAAGVAAICLALSAYGLGVLPTRWWAVGLVAGGIVGFCIDVQAGAPRAWTVIGTLALAVGSGLLFDGHRPPLLVLAAILVGVALLMIAGMPAVVRTRFSTPTIGRESMVGEEGTALSAISPEGVVEVRHAPWRARTNRATPIAAGDAVRVAAIDGLLLEVEPLEGAARDAGH